MLRDSHGRLLTYLRVSIVKGCNLTCNYCMPERIPFQMRELLSPLELERLVGRLVERGVYKLRLTGGEPTIRPDVVEIAARLARLAGVHEVALSTNAVQLRALAVPLWQAGVGRLNVSLDTLRPEVFERITGYAALPRVLDGIAAARQAGFRPIKLNTVVMRGINDGEIEDLVRFATAEGLELRFIEMMPAGVNRGLQAQHFVPNRELLQRLGGLERWEPIALERDGNGPARTFRDRHDPQAPPVGFVNPLSENFCGDCNRLRLTADGNLRTCLFGDRDVPLRPLLAGDDWAERLDAAIDAALLAKPRSHRLAQGDCGTMANFAQVGG